MEEGKTKTCRRCGQEIPKGAAVCPECGKKTRPLALRLWWVWLLIAVLGLSALGSSRAEAAEPIPVPMVETL